MVLTESANSVLYVSKCSRGVRISQWVEAMGFWEKKCTVCDIPKEETYNKYGDTARKLKSAILETWEFPRIHLLKYRTASLIDGRFANAVGNKPISPGYTKTGCLRW